MRNGRRAGLLLAGGVIAGSYIWSTAAALGLAALLLTQIWMLELVRFAGAGYLIWLAIKSCRSALKPSNISAVQDIPAPHGHFLAGLLLHLTNPKPILFFGTLFSIGVPHGTNGVELTLVVLIVGLHNAAVFLLYALMFSHSGIAGLYRRARRWFEIVFALCFGAVGLRIFVTRIE